MTTSTELNELERRQLEAFRDHEPVAPWNRTDGAEWLRFGMRCQLEAGRMLRFGSVGAAEVELKADGSPATPLESRVESTIREMLSEFLPDAAFLGEESGGAIPESGWSVAVDPVDGTWAFLSELTTWTSTLCVFQDGRPFAGFVMNPSTGELGYALLGRPTRLLRSSMFGEPASARTLGGPERTRGPEKLVVNLHPSPIAGPVQAALQEAWKRGEVRSLRSPGGSPAYGLLEAARGRYVYVNLWARRSSEAFDLAAGVLLVREAGGDVVDLDGRPIDSCRHAGAWIAGLGGPGRDRVAAIVRAARP